MKNGNKIQLYWNYGLLLMLLFGFILRYCIYKKPFEQLYNVKDYCLKEKNSFFEGKVVKTFLDYNNKSAFYFYLVNKTDTIKRYIFLIVLNPENYINEGDSVVKKKGESKYYIYKNRNPDSLVVLEFDCSYWEKK